MSILLKLLGGSLGPYLAGGVGVVLALALGWAGIQGARLKHAKADLAEARAALYVPGTDGNPSKQTWKARAEADGRDLATCRTNTAVLQDAIDRQNASLTAAAAEGRQRAAEAEQAVQAARTATQRAEAAARSILNHQPVGGDVCARALDVDRQFVEQLR